MSKKVQSVSESDGDAGLPKMKTRSIGLTDEIWKEISELAHGHDSIPGMLRDCLRRGILQMKKERAELKFLEAIAEIKRVSLNSPGQTSPTNQDRSTDAQQGTTP